MTEKKEYTLAEKLAYPISFKWKVQTVSQTKKKGQCVGYIDARQVMSHLDKCVGIGNWQDDYKWIGDKICGGIGIKIDSEWIWKWDTGSESSYEKEKGQFSDAFKRAGVKWGIGRFLYDLEMKWIDTNKSGKGARPVDAQGNVIWDLTKHFNKK